MQFYREATMSRFEAIKQFLREVRIELKKVTWPSRKDTMYATIIVLISVFIFGFFLGIVDVGLSRLIRLIL